MTLRRDKSNSLAKSLQTFGKWAALAVYLIGLLAFLLAELGVPWLVSLRATNQRILIFVLFFLPFVLPAAASALQSLSLRISGQELRVEMRETREKIDKEVTKVAGKVSGQLGDYEAMLAPILGGPDPGRDARLERKEIVIGGKGSHSAWLLGEILAAHIEASLPGVTCLRRLPNGSTLRNFSELQQGWIDMYIEFTGTACNFHNIDFRGKSPEELHVELDALSRERYDATWLDFIGLRDNYCIVMNAEEAKERKIKSLSDLASQSNRLRFAGYPEFLSRADGLRGLERTYRMKFAEIKRTHVDSSYEMIEKGDADVAVGQESDPDLFTELFVALEDDRQHFPDYHGAPLVRYSTLQAIDGLKDCLRGLKDSLDTTAMSALVRECRSRPDDPAIMTDIAKKFIEDPSRYTS